MEVGDALFAVAEDQRIAADEPQSGPDAFGYFRGPSLMSVLAYAHGETSYPHPTYQGFRLAPSPCQELRCGHGPHS